MFVVFVPFQGFRLAPLTAYILSNDEIVAKDAVLDEDFTAGKDAERERLASCGGGRSRNFRFKTITPKPAERASTGYSVKYCDCPDIFVRQQELLSPSDSLWGRQDKGTHGYMSTADYKRY
jgi:hypothetical protein